MLPTLSIISSSTTGSCFDLLSLQKQQHIET
jgi:hypothetical protein